MKIFKWSFLAVLAFTISNTFAQKLDRSKLPADAPAVVIKLGKTEKFTLANGLKVIVVANNKLPRVAYNLILDRDPMLEEDAAGYLSATGDLMSAGTKTRTKAQFNEEVDFIGGVLSTSSGGIYGASLKKHSDKLLTLMSDALLNPNFSQTELDKIKKQMKSGLASQKGNANAVANKVAQILLYGKNHPYGEQTTVESIDKITLETCQNYYNTYYKPNIGYLAIVGDITLAEAKVNAEKYFGSWQKGNVPSFNMPEVAPIGKSRVILVDKPSSVQSIINITNTTKLPRGEETIKATVMNDILGSSEARLYNNLREKHGYTYGAYSSVGPDKFISRFNAGASVRNAVTDSSITEFLYEIKNMVATKPSEEELKKSKTAVAGSFVFGLENPQTLASYALNIARYNLPEDFYANYLKVLESTTVDDIQSLAAKHIKPNNQLIVVVGKASEIAEKLKKFGEVEYYDVDGNKVEPPAPTKAAPEGITADDVLSKYATALGGKAAIDAIKDVETKMSATTKGGPNGEMSLITTVLRKAPNMNVLQVQAMGMTMMRMAVDGKKAKMTGRMGDREITGNDLEATLAKAYMFSDINYKLAGVEASFDGVEKIDGVDCNKIKFSKAGQSWYDYFDTKTNLKVRSSETRKGPQGETITNTDFADYKEYNGVKFPTIVKQKFGPMELEYTVDSMKINKGIEDKKFSLD